jgi:hypothetical protein
MLQSKQTQVDSQLSELLELQRIKAGKEEEIRVLRSQASED